ncbi:hypothetical protein [Gimesia aquarii]|uniref:Uncharacterized protein n=1 Tax=Gimesia aquarii TaxID=2527964 RepID=A0A517X055_9PLAN|nr:hypothetical protein [Gimesia aquarii]QDU10889.1 hypothetical protein V202x_43020 [Gimesia aquarii]
MQTVSINNFGFLIAYLVPGFTTLWGISYFSTTVQSWIGILPSESPTVGGFLYITIGSVAVGLTVSTIRWIVIDTIHHWTGISDPGWDFSKLQKNINAFDRLIEIHYHYYQFYANSIIAVIIVYSIRRISLGLWSTPLGWMELLVGIFLLIFFAGSRDTLRKYYKRTTQLLEMDVEEVQTEDSPDLDSADVLTS